MEYAKSMNTALKPRDSSPPSDISPQRRNTKSMNPGIYAKNHGTSYLVAPLNVTTNERIIKVQQQNQEFLKNYNKKYMSAHVRELRKGGSVVHSGEGSLESSMEQLLNKKSSKQNISLLRT